MKKKLKLDGTFDKYKAHLVAKDFRQRENIDFFATFSPPAIITSFRVPILVAAIYKLIVYQMDVKTIFLNDDLDEKVYMDQPEGFAIHWKENKVGKLYKFDNLMISNG